MNGESMTSSAIGDDTIELQLTPEQLLELSRAAEEAEAVAPGFSPPQPFVEVSPSGHRRGWHHISIAKMAAATIAYAAFAWWGASKLAGQPQPPVIAAARPAVVIPRPVLVTSSPLPSVRVINPFDATEVFEFPAGTSGAESREQVAQILLQRARERQGQWERTKPAVSIRTASLYRSP